MEIDRFDEPPGRVESALTLGAGRRERHRQSRSDFGARVEQPEVGPTVVDEPAAVGRSEASVEVTVPCVTSESRTRRGYRVDVADAFVVGQEIDPAPDPHRVCQVPRQPDQLHEFSIAGTIDPEGSGPSTAVTLQAGRVEGVATYYNTGSVPLERHRAGRSPSQRPRSRSV